MTLIPEWEGKKLHSLIHTHTRRHTHLVLPVSALYLSLEKGKKQPAVHREIVYPQEARRHFASFINFSPRSRPTGAAA